MVQKPHTCSRYGYSALLVYGGHQHHRQTQFSNLWSPIYIINGLSIIHSFMQITAPASNAYSVRIEREKMYTENACYTKQFWDLSAKSDLKV